MPRLSEPMRAALEAAERYGHLSCIYGRWGNPSGAAPWVRQSTATALANRGLLRQDGHNLVITQEGRVAIFRIFPKEGREAIGMKEGEDV